MKPTNTKYASSNIHITVLVYFSYKMKSALVLFKNLFQMEGLDACIFPAIACQLPVYSSGRNQFR